MDSHSDHAQSQNSASLQINLFGGFSVWVQGAPLPSMRTRKEQWLLALLLLRQGRETARNWLAGTLWPDSAESMALSHLRRSLSLLRRALGEEAFRLQSPTPRTLRFDLSGAFCDLFAFDTLVQEGIGEETSGIQVDSLQKAVALYQGPLLAGSDAPWIFPERETREQVFLKALQILAHEAQKNHHFADAITYLRRILAFDPLQEMALRALLEAFAANGQVAELIHTYRQFRLMLLRELQTDPDAQTVALYRRLCAEAAGSGTKPQRESEASLAPDSPKLTSWQTFALPYPRTVLIGREEDCAEIREAMQSSRLVTLTGTGGVGKTRLVLAVAHSVAPNYPDGVWFADLSALTDPAQVDRAIAVTLDVRETPGLSTCQNVCAALRERSALLILDNCEHLIEACAVCADTLLSACPDLRLLTTSREPLRIPGEKVWRAQPLPAPPAASDHDADHTFSLLLDYAAVRLFVARAEEADPTFSLTPQNAAAVAAVCRRLDGVPLALELAAAHLPAFSAAQLLSQLDNAFALLTRGSRVATTRHQSLRAVLDWSYTLLSAQEQALLRSLSVFVGSWPLEAAEAVSGTEQASTIPGLLSSLVDKSLVMVDPHRKEGDPQQRYRLLETVRQYAWERCRAAGEAFAVRQRHLDHYFRQVERLTLLPDMCEVWQPLERDYDNIHVALEWGVTEPSLLERSCKAAWLLQSFWEIRSFPQEERDFWERVLTREPPPMPVQRAMALYCLGSIALRQDHYEKARALLTESIAISTQTPEGHILSRALLDLGRLSLRHSEQHSAQELLAQALMVARQTGDRVVEGWTLATLGAMWEWQGSLAEADRCYTGALEQFRQSGDRLNAARFIHHRDYFLRADGGDPTRLRLLCEESLTLFRTLRDQGGIADVLSVLGRLACDEGDFTEARYYLTESLALKRAIRDRMGEASLLRVLGEVAQAESDFDRAKVLFQESLTLRDTIGEREGAVMIHIRLGEIALQQGERDEAQRNFQRALNVAHALSDADLYARALHEIEARSKEWEE